jgi:hypothetical protein
MPGPHRSYQEERPGWRKSLDRLQSIRWNRFVVGSIGLVAVLLLGLTVATFASVGEDQPVRETRNASPIDADSPRPPDNPALPPNDDPAADSAFGIEAQKLLDELRSHSVPFTDADANILVDIGDKNVARNDPDLTADDPEISEQISLAFPQYTDQQRADTVRCLAEYVEQTVAKNHGTVPPDGQDHN